MNGKTEDRAKYLFQFYSFMGIHWILYLWTDKGGIHFLSLGEVQIWMESGPQTGGRLWGGAPGRGRCVV